MAEPQKLSVKRKRDETPVDVLRLEAQGGRRTKVVYIRQGSDHEIVKITTKAEQNQEQTTPPARDRTTDGVSKRVFHFTRKRKASEAALPTFQEKRSKGFQRGEIGVDSASDSKPNAPTIALKRPGKGTALRKGPNGTSSTETEEQRKKMQALADKMHKFALEEVKRESEILSQEEEPTVLLATHQRQTVSAPKISNQESEARHRQRVASNDAASRGQDVDMEDADYVYDTYVLAPNSHLNEMQICTPGENSNIGYLVIADEDQDLWESYLEDETGDKEFATDEEDENAEDYYGADYPEDELDSDDEFDRNAYAYREHGASDDEEWNDDYEAMMNPWKHRGLGKKTLIDDSDDEN